MRHALQLVVVLALAATGCVTKVVDHSIPCEPECSGPLGVCDLFTGDCVQCVGDSECTTADRPYCEARTRCVECTDDSHCTGESCIDGFCGGCSDNSECPVAAPVCNAGTCGACSTSADCPAGPADVCDSSSGACVECLTGADCSGSAPVCDGGECVECLADTDCPASAPVCDATTSTCGPCGSNADCGVGRPYCDLGSGACVECSTASQELDCGTESCDPATRACSGIDRNSRGTCESCVSDSDCTGGNRCVPFDDGNATGGLCLTPAAAGCTAPYTTVTAALASLSGAAAEAYCGVASATTCAAVLAVGDACGAAACPTGSLCVELLGFGDVCTLPCASMSDCFPSGVASGCTLPAGHCGMPTP